MGELLEIICEKSVSLIGEVLFGSIFFGILTRIYNKKTPLPIKILLTIILVFIFIFLIATTILLFIGCVYAFYKHRYKEGAFLLLCFLVMPYVLYKVTKQFIDYKETGYIPYNL